MERSGKGSSPQFARRGRRGSGPSPWVGSYVHFALPAPRLGRDEIALLDEALGADPAWRPVQVEQSEPLLTRQWEHAGTGEELVLALLGFSPLLATLGAPVTAGRATAEGLERVAAALPAAGGAQIGDADLPSWIEAVQARWPAVVDAQRRIEELSVWLTFGQCTRCGELTHLEAPHCRACGHRVTDAERAQQEARRGQAEHAVSAARAELDALGRGEGIVDDWPAPASEGEW